MITQGYLPPEYWHDKRASSFENALYLVRPYRGGIVFYFVNFLPFWMYIPLGRVSFDVPT